MKPWMYVLCVILSIALIASCVLYWVHPRVVIREVPASIPDSLLVHFKPAKPDTVYKVVLRTIEREGKKDTVFVPIEAVYPDTMPMIDVVEKTFRKTLTGVAVESFVKTYSFGEVFDIENNIKATIDKKWVADEINKVVTIEVSKAKRKGIYIGAGAAIVVGAGLCLLSR
jgi:hypothetical protein